MKLDWRELILANRWQKLFAFGLSVLIWFTVRSTEQLRILEDSADGTRTFLNVPIVVLTRSTDLGRYVVRPETVEIELRGTPSDLRQIPADLIEAYVNLVDLGTTPQMMDIHVNPPPGTGLISVTPARIQVDRLKESAPVKSEP
jgi:hypothetical protein